MGIRKMIAIRIFLIFSLTLKVIAVSDADSNVEREKDGTDDSSMKAIVIAAFAISGLLCTAIVSAVGCLCVRKCMNRKEQRKLEENGVDPSLKYKEYDVPKGESEGKPKENEEEK